MAAPREKKRPYDVLNRAEERGGYHQGARGMVPRGAKDAPRNAVACEMAAQRKKKQPEGVLNRTEEREG